MASRVGRGTALPFLDRGIRMGLVVNSTPKPHFTPGIDPVPILQEAGWAPGPVRTAENLAPPGFDPQTVQPVAQSLYRLCYLGPRTIPGATQNIRVQITRNLSGRTYIGCVARMTVNSALLQHLLPAFIKLISV
jgi:hypothetical protein